MNQADYQAIAAAAAPAAPTPGAKPSTSQSLFSPRTLTHTVYPRLLSSLKILLPTSIFALKFLEWWHASDFARQLSRKAAEGLELPAPTISGIPKTPAATPTTPSKSGVTFATTDDEKSSDKEKEEKDDKDKIKPPISATTNLPIFTVPPATGSACPICLSPIQTPTASQTGYVFCYTCIFRWLEGEHPRQVAFMQGGNTEEAWKDESGGNREGSWEDGRGRCAVSGRRLLGGSGGLRRVMV